MFIPDAFNLLMLSVPLLFVDWQLALIWAIASQNPELVLIFQTMSFGGFEVWVGFVAFGVVRLLFFRYRG